MTELSWRNYAAASDTPLRLLHEEHRDIAACEVMTKVRESRLIVAYIAISNECVHSLEGHTEVVHQGDH